MYQALPRLLALSEVVWTPKAELDFNSFCAKLPFQFSLLEREGYHFYIPALGIMNDDLFYTDSYAYELPVEVSGFDIRYTLDGSDPVASSPIYNGPINITESSVVKAAPFLQSGKRGTIKSATITKSTLSPAVEVASVEPGINATYYRGMISTLADFGKLQNVRSYVASSIGLPEDRDADGFGLQFDGYLSVDEDAVYSFALKSDDGSELFIDGEKVIDADGIHGDSPVFGRKALAKGLHKIEVRYFDNAYGEALQIEWGKGNAKLEVIAPECYFRDKK